MELMRRNTSKRRLLHKQKSLLLSMPMRKTPASRRLMLRCTKRATETETVLSAASYRTISIYNTTLGLLRFFNHDIYLQCINVRMTSLLNLPTYSLRSSPNIRRPVRVAFGASMMIICRTDSQSGNQVTLNSAFLRFAIMLLSLSSSF